MLPHGKILLVANPTAQSGYGADAAHMAATDLRRLLGADALDVLLTRYPGHAREVAKTIGPEYRTLLVLGGDGVIHEVVNGLMSRPASERPIVGVIPVGSGNDYAQSINMPLDLGQAVRRVARGKRQFVDIGWVNGEYFMETLSFGLDAGIALDTVERRKKSKQKGFPLYLASGIDQLFNHLELYEYSAKLMGVQGQQRNRRLSSVVGIPSNDAPDGEGEEAEEAASTLEAAEATKAPEAEEASAPEAGDATPQEDCDGKPAQKPGQDANYSDVEVKGESFLFAVNLGPTYGGGFKVAPHASLSDGLFDVCIAHPPLSVPFATMVFLLAKNGNHTGFKQIESFQVQELELSFDRSLPIQVDGEPLPWADSYHVRMFPSAIEMIVG